MKTNRIEELMTSMKSFGKESYHKSELLDEMLLLQKEIVELTFSEDHVATADLKIWDVEKHLEQLNADCGNIADEELEKFMEESKDLCNLIKAEISGNRGEYKAFRTLEYLKSNNKVLKNIELSDGEIRTELDAVVITPKCVTIVEVKNTAKDIFIDEEGNYYRTGEFLRWDCNIASKMSLKEELLGKVLESAGLGRIKIQSVVVFTNNRIEVQNKYRQIRTCFVSQLAYIIDGYKMDDIMTVADMENIEMAIEVAKCKKSYSFEFDVNQYKADFANLMAILEFARNQEEELDESRVTDIEKEVINMPLEAEKKRTFISTVKSVFSSKQFRLAGSTAAVITVSVVSGLIVANSVGKGCFKV